MSLRLDGFLGLPESKPTVEELIAWIKGNPGRPILQNGRTAGKIYRHPCFGKIYVTYRTHKHVFKKWGSIGVARDIVIKLIKEGVDQIIVVFTDTKEGYLAPPRKFLEQGRSLWFGYEAESQLHLPLTTMEKL